MDTSLSTVHSYENRNGDYSVTFSVYDPPIFKAKLEGYCRVEDARETERVLEVSQQKVQKQYQLDKLYFIVDISSFTGTSWKAKMHLQNVARRFFQEKNIAHISLINPTIIVENMVYLARKMNPDFRITICESEKEAIDEIRILIEGGTPSSFEESDDVLESDFILRNNHRIPIENRREWNLELTGDHSVRFYLIDKRIVLYREFGTSVDIEDVPKVISTLESVIAHTGGKDLIFITDFTNLEFVNLKVRKAMAKGFYPFRPHWSFKYHIFKRLIKIMYFVYMQLDSSVKKDSKLVSSWQAALDHYISNNYELEPRKEKTIHTKEDYTELTREELISLLEQKDDIIEHFEEIQDQRIQELFYSISRISWDDDFEPLELMVVEKDDPFAPLSNAISLLERDVYEIVSDLKNFNEALESKVLERTSELRKQNEELKKVNTELDGFVYKTSHDLRAPLVSVMGLVNIAKLENDPVQKEVYLEMIAQSMKKLDGFIRDIIDFSRNTRFDIQFTDIDFKEIIEDIWGDLDVINLSKIEKRVQIQNSIPFSCDLIRLKMILGNLISNAIRYQKEDREKQFVSVNVNIDNIGANIHVEDNGQGIASVHLPHIFEMFFRASESSMGSGLGLYIVNEAVTKLKGKIGVESKVGQGSRFNIYIPHSPEV